MTLRAVDHREQARTGLAARGASNQNGFLATTPAKRFVAISAIKDWKRL
jgi:hypothetical protein